MSTKLQRLWKRFSSRRFREAFVSSHLATNVAAQITTLREKRGLSQSDLAELAGMKQSRISVLEDPANQSLSIATLKRIAAAFDVALVVRFVPYSQVAKSATDSSEDKFHVRSFNEDYVGAAVATFKSLTAAQEAVRSSEIVVRYPSASSEVVNSSPSVFSLH